MLALSALQSEGLALGSVFLVAAGLTPVARRVALRLGMVDHPAAHKFHRDPTPYLGGLAVLVAATAGLIAMTVARAEVRIELGAIALGGLAVSGVGLVDDWRVLPASPRLAVQALAAVGLWIGGIRLGPTGLWVLDLGLSIFAVLAITNAVNLLDNMDGLSAGTVGIAALFAFVVAHVEGQHLVALVAVILAGACLGFLPYNVNPARIFLGDSGTLFMGFLTAVVLMKLRLVGEPVATRAAVPLLIVAVPLFDMALVMISRRRGGRRVFRGGTDHSSHRLVALGATPRQAAAITWGVAVGTGSIALALLAAHRATVTAWACVAVALATVLLMAYLEQAHDRLVLGLPRGGRSAGVEPVGAAMVAEGRTLSEVEASS
jgi:UDP-GlcNAc:undecaprenyl-phosphate/decaprenyl-phosphate GlcNAc-1-phosphate transferase